MALDPDVLVVGGSSRVGVPLTCRLLELGVGVRTSVPEERASSPDVTAGCGGETVVRLDLADPSTWDAALDGVGAVYLVRPTPVVQVRRWIRPFLHRAAGAGVDRVVFQSVAGLRPGVPHAQVEADLDAIGLPRAFLRLPTLHQRLADTYADLVRRERVLRMPVGRGRISFVDARDVAEVAARVLVAAAPPDHLAWTLSSGDLLSGTETAGILGRAIGEPVRFDPVPWGRHRRELLGSGEDLPTVHVRMMLNVCTRLGPGSASDPTLARLLDRRPTSVSEFVTENRSAWEVPES